MYIISFNGEQAKRTKYPGYFKGKKIRRINKLNIKLKENVEDIERIV